MKLLWLLLLLPLLSSAQTEVRDSVTYLTFKVNHPQNISEKDFDEVDFSKEQPESEFILHGDIPLTYRFKLQNDTIAILYKIVDHKSVHTEAMGYQSYFLYRDDDGYLHSNFKITDFDKDGDEDLLCWIYSNMNGNVWTIIWLNDQKTQKLVKLYNTADDTEIWDRPEYDPAKQIINTTLDAGVYGISNEATYKLEGLTAIPLRKYEENRSQVIHIIQNEYVGKRGKWKLRKSQKIIYDEN